jgi:hypothetical protein
MAAAGCFLIAPTSVSAAERYSFSVGGISTKQACQYFQNSEGRAAAVATPFSLAVAAEWRTWWVRDCVSQFPTLRASVEAALASTGRFNGDQRYYIDVTIEDVSSGAPVPAPIPGGRAGYSFAKTSIFTTYSIVVRDGSGRSVYGSLGKKSVELSQEIIADGTRSRSVQGGEALYGVLQNELALTIARTVAFHFAPMRVIRQGGQRIVLDYGAPFLKLGDTVRVPVNDGLSVVPFIIVSATGTTAIAETDGDFADLDIRPGAEATFVELDDPAANGRRYDRVRLP